MEVYPLKTSELEILSLGMMDIMPLDIIKSIVAFLDPIYYLSFSLTTRVNYLFNVDQKKITTKQKCESKHFVQYPRHKRDIIKYNARSLVKFNHAVDIESLKLMDIPRSEITAYLDKLAYYKPGPEPSSPDYVLEDLETEILYIRYRTYEQIKANKSFKHFNINRGWWNVNPRLEKMLFMNKNVTIVTLHYNTIAGITLPLDALKYKINPIVFDYRKVKCLNDVLNQSFSVIKECYKKGKRLDINKRNLQEIILCERPKVVKWLWQVNEITNKKLISEALFYDDPELIYSFCEKLGKEFWTKFKYTEVKSKVLDKCTFMYQRRPGACLTLAIKYCNLKLVEELCQVVIPQSDDKQEALKLIPTSIFTSQGNTAEYSQIESDCEQIVNIVFSFCPLVYDYISPDNIREDNIFLMENYNTYSSYYYNFMGVDYAKYELYLVLTAANLSDVLAKIDKEEMVYLYQHFGGKTTKAERDAWGI